MRGKYMNMQIYIHRHDRKNPIFLLKFVKTVIYSKITRFLKRNWLNMTKCPNYGSELTKE